MNPSCLTRNVQGSGSSIMIWGLFCGHETGVPGGLTNSHGVPRYKNATLHPSMLHSYPDDGHFMDDNATTNCARRIQNCLDEYQSDFQHLPWSLYSPHLNPIEKRGWGVWGKGHVRQHYPLSSNLQDLKSCIANAWYSLGINALQNLDSMP
ncbi:hypothetical protein TNCV_4740361 [Trichonephila clavipes]|nr:hypothetical protein TNCV_4740361 [Trichonephila clavipes]